MKVVLKQKSKRENKMFTDFARSFILSSSGGVLSSHFTLGTSKFTFLFMAHSLLLPIHLQNILEWMAQISGEAFNKVEEATADITISIIPDILFASLALIEIRRLRSQCFLSWKSFFFCCSYHRWDHAPPTRKLNKRSEEINSRQYCRESFRSVEGFCIS